MEQIVVQVRDKAKADLLSINRSTTWEDALAAKDIDEQSDFFAMDKLWADRNEDLASIRQKAWPRR